MKLTDFFYTSAHERGTLMPIITPGGEDTGETLTVRGPGADKSELAGRAYSRAALTVSEELKPLYDQCEASGDFRPYNIEYAAKIRELNDVMALELVTGWSLEDEFSTEALANLLKEFKGLSAAIVAHHTKTKVELSEK